MSLNINASVGPLSVSASVGGSSPAGSSSTVDQIRSQQQDLRQQQLTIQQQIQAGQVSPEQGQNQLRDIDNKIRDLDNKVLDANNAAQSAAQNGGQASAPPAGYSGASSFEPAPRANPPVVLNPPVNRDFKDESGGGSKPGASGGLGNLT